MTPQVAVYKCKKCGKLFLPEQLLCPNCGSNEAMKTSVPSTGTIETYTTIRVPPLGHTAPYIVAIIKLDAGLYITGILPHDQEIDIGTRVNLTSRETNEKGMVFTTQ